MSKFSRGSVLHSLSWKFLERCSVQLVSFIVTILLARILCPEVYGIIALVTVFISVANVLVEGGFNTALIQKKNADQLDFSTIFYATLGVSVILYLVLFFCAPAISSFYNDGNLIPVVRILALSLVFFAINSIQKAYLTRKLQFKKLFYSSFGAIITSGVVGIIMALKGFGVWALVAQSLVAQIATTLIMWVTVKWRPTLQFSFDRFKSLFDYGWKIFASNMLVNIFINVRSLIIGKVYSASSLAYFDRGKQFPAIIIENINTSIQSVLFPVLSSEQDDRDSVKAMVRRSIKTSAFVIFPLVFGLAITAKPLVQALLTDKWLGAVHFIQIFCAAYLLMPMQVANIEAIKSLGYSGTTLKLESSKKVIELIILLITIPIGVEAIAWGIVVYNAISLIINAAPNKKYLNYGIREQFKDIAPTLIISALMGMSIMAFALCGMKPVLLLIIQIAAGIAIYLLLNILFKNEAYMYVRNLIIPQLKKFQ